MQLSQFWQTKKEGHKIISQLFHSNFQYFRTFIFDKMTENIVSRAQKSALQFTLTINYRERGCLAWY